MWRSAVRNLMARKMRLLTTGLAVMLGVALCGVLPYGEELLRTMRSRQTRARLAI